MSGSRWRTDESDGSAAVWLLLAMGKPAKSGAQIGWLAGLPLHTRTELSLSLTAESTAALPHSQLDKEGRRHFA